MIQRTFSIIKPDAVAKNCTGSINNIIENAGLRIIGQKRIRITKETAMQFYLVHKDKPFYDDLCVFLSSGPIIVQVLEGENAIAENRRVMGATDPKMADAGTIRALHGASIDCNAVHGSDAPETAALEIKMFFKDEEILS